MQRDGRLAGFNSLLHSQGLVKVPDSSCRLFPQKAFTTQERGGVGEI